MPAYFPATMKFYLLIIALLLTFAALARADYIELGSYKVGGAGPSHAALMKVLQRDPQVRSARSCGKPVFSGGKYTDSEKPAHYFSTTVKCVGNNGRTLKVSAYTACVIGEKECEIALVRTNVLFADNVKSAIIVDLDLDGKPDLVQVVDYGRKNFNSLEIFLTETKQALSFDHLLSNGRGNDRHPYYQYGLKPRGNNGLSIGQSRDQGDTSERNIYIDFSVEKGVPQLNLYGHTFYEFHMGGESVHTSETYDFDKQLGESSDDDNENHESIEKKWAFQGDCHITLASFDRGGLPGCARE